MRVFTGILGGGAIGGGLGGLGLPAQPVSDVQAFYADPAIYHVRGLQVQSHHLVYCGSGSGYSISYPGGSVLMLMSTKEIGKTSSGFELSDLIRLRESVNIKSFPLT